MSDHDSQVSILFLDYSCPDLGQTTNVPKRAGMTVCVDKEHCASVMNKLSELGNISFQEPDHVFTAEHYPLVIQLERKPTGEICIQQFPYEQFKERIVQLGKAFISKNKKDIDQ